MIYRQVLQRVVRTVLAALLIPLTYPAASEPTTGPSFPYPEKLSYRVEWRLILAGQANLQLSRAPGNTWNLALDLQSAGLVSRLYRVLDSYKAGLGDRFCGAGSTLDAQEGKKHTLTHLTFDDTRHRVDYEQRDLIKNTTEKNSLSVAPCTYEIAGALAAIRTMSLEPGKSLTVPITDGKKMAYAKVQAEAKENLNVDGQMYSTTRYEAFVFDNVLYRRKGRLLVWISDGPDHIPVQFRLQFGFPVGTINVELEKQEKL